MDGVHTTIRAADGDGPATTAVPGLRVARWWETFPGTYTPTPGTVREVHADHLVVEFDGLAGNPPRTRRLRASQLTTWTDTEGDNA